MPAMSWLLRWACVAAVSRGISARIENLHAEDDTRTMIAVDTFGYDKDGMIDLTMKNLRVQQPCVSSLTALRLSPSLPVLVPPASCASSPLATRLVCGNVHASLSSP